MPYASASSDVLPSSVRKLPKALRELWVRVFNANYDAADEAHAFKLAWGAVRHVQSAKKARLWRDVDLAAWRANFESHEASVQPEDVQLISYTAPATLAVKTTRDGHARWTLISSGAFRDRDRQIVSSDFLRDAVAFADAHNLRGSATLWHVKGTRVGTCDAQELVGEPPVLLETGLFDDTPAGRKAAKYYAAHASEMGASLEFLFSRLTADGVYEPPGVIVRRSFLPRQHAAFPWSAMQLKESTMAKTRAEQIAHLAAVMEVSEDEMAKMLEHIEAGTKTLADLGVDHKEADAAPETDVPAETSAPVTEATVEPPAPVAEVAKESSTPAPVSEAVAASAPVPTDVEVVLPPETVNALAQQVLSAIDSQLKSFEAALATLNQTLSAVQQTQGEYNTTLAQLDSAVKSLKTSDDAKIAQAVANLPRATIKSLQAGERPTERAPEKIDAPAESMLARAKATLYG